MKIYLFLIFALLIASCGILNPTITNVHLTVKSENQKIDTYVITTQDCHSNTVYGPSFFKKGDRVSIALNAGYKKFFVEGYINDTLVGEGSTTVEIDTTTINYITLVLTPVFRGTDITSQDPIEGHTNDEAFSGSLISNTAVQGYRFYRVVIDGANNLNKEGMAIVEAHFSITGVDSFYPHPGPNPDIYQSNYTAYYTPYLSIPRQYTYTWPPYALFNGDTIGKGGISSACWIVIDSLPWEIILDMKGTDHNRFDSFYVCGWDTTKYTTPSSIKIYGTNDVVTEDNYYQPYQVHWMQIASAILPKNYMSISIPLHY